MRPRSRRACSMPIWARCTSQRRRQVIQQVRIVHPDDHPGFFGAGQQRVAGLANQPCRIRADHSQRRRERASCSARAEAVATAHRVSAPRRCAAASASRANRLLPTPAAPASTIPAGPFRRQISPLITLSSSARPVSGHVGAIPRG